MKNRLALAVRLLGCSLLLTVLAGPVMAQETYREPPPELAKLVDVAPPPAVSLSPTGTHLMLMDRPSLPTIGELAEPELRIAGLRLNPRNNGPSRSSGYTKLTIRTLDGGGEMAVTGLPAEPNINNVSWSPDGQHVAFTVSSPERIDLYTAAVADGRARKATEAAVNAMYYGRPYAWVAGDNTLIVRTIPAARGTEPAEPLAPAGPVIQENIGSTAPARTYQDLLKDPYDEALFAYYLQTQLVSVTLDGHEAPLGTPGLITNAAPSPNGTYVLFETIQVPCSYLVPASRFAHHIDVLDRQGQLVARVAELPVAEEVPTGFGSVPTGIRSADWRDDAPATLVWVEALDEGDARAEVEFRDEMFALEAPFDGEPASLIKLPLRYGGISWSEDGFALANESWWASRTRRIYVIEPDSPGGEPRLLFDLSYEDSYNDPGSPMTTSTPQGTRVLLTADDGQSIYLSGTGASPEGNRPFLRKMDLDTGETEELFRSAEPYYERPVTLLDPDEMTLLTLRETTTEPANYFVRDLKGGDATQLTHFPHPYPELADVQKEFITYPRADGVQLSATLYLPPGYDAERDGALPTFLWAYPREFKSADAAGQITDSPYTFKNMSYWGALPWVTRGYAVLDDASMPIVGEGDQEPNDSFVDQLVMSAQAAIDEGVRRGVVDPERVGVGGHSYGAFMTANLLAHSDLFRAGIARSGAYNRSLTPFGFQAEERTFWEAPEIYFAMSPFMHANDVNEPLLLIHGQADNNSGTFPIQSERFYNALKGHGQTARLVMLPHESHGYRARESILHMLWEMDNWLETYVKNTPSSVTDPTGE
jgi:dipeptidyl aminopeptidase/acylaminoacyl peptidase